MSDLRMFDSFGGIMFQVSGTRWWCFFFFDVHPEFGEDESILSCIYVSGALFHHLEEIGRSTVFLRRIYV